MTPPSRVYIGDIWTSCQTETGIVLPHDVVWIGKRWKDNLPDSPWMPSASKRSVAGDDIFIESYREEILARPDAAAFILSVCGKRLACYCRDSQVCHADVIIELYKEALQSVEGERLATQEAPSSDSEGSDDEASAAADSPRSRAARVEFQRSSIMDGVAAEERHCDADAITALMEGPIPAHGLFVHAKIGTWHKGSSSSDKLACKRNTTTNGIQRYARMGAWPATSSTWCSDCKKILLGADGELHSEVSDEESA
jgi:hypothetical protein